MIPWRHSSSHASLSTIDWQMVCPSPFVTVHGKTVGVEDKILGAHPNMAWETRFLSVDDIYSIITEIMHQHLPHVRLPFRCKVHNGGACQPQLVSPLQDHRIRFRPRVECGLVIPECYAVDWCKHRSSNTPTRKSHKGSNPVTWAAIRQHDSDSEQLLGPQKVPAGDSWQRWVCGQVHHLVPTTDVERHYFPTVRNAIGNAARTALVDHQQVGFTIHISFKK
jgi:hypothetical protein